MSLRAVLSLLLVACGFVPRAEAAKDKRLEALPEIYRLWLEREVVYIITPEERSEFLDLGADPARDTFIRDFWNVRDPDPLTPENEFLIEHRKRMAYADKYLGSGSPRPGWQTDRGRVYILLGPPEDIRRTVSSNEIYPHEIWTYHDLARLGLPGTTWLIFFRAHGQGEYILFDPVLDRSRLFPPSTQIAFDDPSALRKAFDVDVERAIVSVAPGYSANASSDVIGELLAPREVPRRIRERGRQLRATVLSQFSAEALPLTLALAAAWNDDGTAAVHLAVVIPPESLHFVEEGEQASMRLDIYGKIKDQQGVEVAVIEQAAAVKLTRAELKERRRHAFAFEAVRYLIPGRYSIEITVQDYASQSVGRAAQSLDVEAPPPGTRIEGPWLGFASGRAADLRKPFVFGGVKLGTRAPLRFGRGETVRAAAMVREAAGLKVGAGTLELKLAILRDGQVVAEQAVSSSDQTALSGARPVFFDVATAGLEPGSYELRLGLRGADGAETSALAAFELLAEAPSQGLILYEEKRSVKLEIDHFNRGLQYLSRSDLDSAARHFRIALDHNARFAPAVVYLARIELIRGDLEAASGLLARAEAIDPKDIDLLVTEGSYHLARKDYAKAVAALERATAVGRPRVEALNALGLAEVGLGDPRAAVAAFERSLELEPRQEAVAARLATLRAELERAAAPR